jgi:hypothetical protein
MKRVLIIVLFVAVLGVVINDGGKCFNAYNSLGSATDQLLSWASLNANHLPAESFAQELGRQATAEGVRVTQYSLEPQGVHIWTETDVAGTWVLGPYMALAKGSSFEKAWTVNRSFVVKKDAVAPYR